MGYQINHDFPHLGPTHVARAWHAHGTRVPRTHNTRVARAWHAGGTRAARAWHAGAPACHARGTYATGVRVLISMSIGKMVYEV